MYVLVGAEPAVPARATLVLRPSGDLPEVLPRLVLGEGDELTVRGYVELIRKAKTDARITGILLRPGSLSSPFWAKIQEVRDALNDFRASGKYVHAWLEYAGDREYYLASVADRVYLLPSAIARPDRRRELRSCSCAARLTGSAPIRTSCMSAITRPPSTPISRRSFTPAHREMADSLNRSQYEQLVRGIAEARKKSEDEVRALIDQGPFLPVDALRLGLIDEVAYEDELDDINDDLRGAEYHRRRRLRRGCRGSATGVTPPFEDCRHQRRRRHQFRPQRLRSDQRRGRRRRFAGRVHPRSARRSLDSRPSCCVSTARAGRPPPRM